MALKPTIYKFKITLSDLDRNYYETLDLTLAQHPSETLERMMARTLAYCINAEEALTFTKGLSTPEEPDIWSHTLDNRIQLWIEVGEPAVDKIKKASRKSDVVKVYSFNTKSDVWWHQENKKFGELKAQISRIDWPGIQAFAALVQRTMDFSITITTNTAYVATENGECEISWEPLQAT